MRKHSLDIAGHQTSVTLEDEFWNALRDIAKSQGRSQNSLVAEIDADRDGNLSSAIRVYVLKAALADRADD
ncbi:MAG: ribbon-helix-helix domain-containing protein [Alphaproteobacteria bacterium]|nr:ribbon-helix-helix domain-containing protein [Alphaproteobacteria bacterium]MBT4086548.1 ribbon-helix-helix domain-containing protein [Alphaproteobacteria bacterium]MBT4543108.1 ribbon-helix-helix domain-containing protein [Alphaproteobacteria bacterium]MBT7745336.1 ribbon-helix-helix domain-containing protein [Alphaproteobacteria bacterium]